LSTSGTKKRKVPNFQEHDKSLYFDRVIERGSFTAKLKTEIEVHDNSFSMGAIEHEP